MKYGFWIFLPGPKRGNCYTSTFSRIVTYNKITEWCYWLALNLKKKLKFINILVVSKHIFDLYLENLWYNSTPSKK